MSTGIYPTRKLTNLAYTDISFNSLTSNYRDGKYGPLSSLIVSEKESIRVCEVSSSHKAVPVESITKSITSLVIGIALQRGEIKSIDQPLIDFFPDDEYVMEKGWETVALRDVLTMRSGIVWNEDARPECRNPLYRMYAADNVYDFIFSRKISQDRSFNYSSANAAVSSQVILKASGMSLAAYADSFLFKPLNIRDYIWANYKNGFTNASGGLYLKPEDLLKIGELCLQKGKWNGQAIVSEEWIDQSFSCQTPVENYLDADYYGYMWWINSAYKSQNGSEPVKICAACGYNNNHLIIIPEREIVIVMNGYSSCSSEKYLLLLNDVLKEKEVINYAMK